MSDIGCVDGSSTVERVGVSCGKVVVDCNGGKGGSCDNTMMKGESCKCVKMDSRASGS